MPAYNAGRYIAEAIQSIINQTYSNWEMIIVNDGSTDDTAAVIESFVDNRITVIRQANRGQCAAANKAFELSKGELIKFFDADDILSENAIEYQVKNLVSKNGYVASAQWGRFYNDDINTFKLNREAVWKDMPPDKWLIESWKNAQPMMQCGLWLIPRRIIEKAGLWDERLSLINDFDFFTRVLINSNGIVFTPEATLYYRSGIAKSLSGTKTSKAYQSAFLSIEQATTSLLAKRNDNEAKLSCANIWQNFIYEIYPYHADLIRKAQEYINHLIKPTIGFPCGGYSKVLLPFLGWKLTKKLQIINHKYNSGV